MKLVYSPQGSRIHELLYMVSNIANEVTLRFDLDGIHLTAKDPSNVSMMGLDVKLSEFLTYDLAGQTDIKRSLRVSDLKPILKRFDKSDSVRIEDDATGMKISSGNKQFIIPLVADDEVNSNQLIPNIEHGLHSGIILGAGIMTDIMKDVKGIDADTVTVELSDKVFRVKGKAELIDYECVPKPDNYAVLARMESDGKAKYASELLEAMMTDKLCIEVTLKWTTDYPMQIEYSDTGYKMVFIIAPRVETY